MQSFGLCLYLCLWLGLQASVVAQDASSNKYYLDDGGISAPKAILKFEALSIIHGEVPLHLEVFAKRNFSLEGGIGLIMPYYVHDFGALLVGSENSFSNNSTGLGLWMAARLYMGEAPEARYWMLQARRRNFQYNHVTELTFNFGKQKIIGGKWVCDYGIGLGVRLQDYSRDAYIFDPDFSFMPILPMYLKFGKIL